jgi:hypothetical protein
VSFVSETTRYAQLKRALVRLSAAIGLHAWCRLGCRRIGGWPIFDDAYSIIRFRQRPGHDLVDGVLVQALRLGGDLRIHVGGFPSIGREFDKRG